MEERHVVVSSPNKPRPADPLIRAVADTIRRTENNYLREGSGPGSRFEGELLEDVQARAAVSVVRGWVPPGETVLVPSCCGFPMEPAQEVFGVRVYLCSYRPGHLRVYENMDTGEQVREDIR